MLERYKTVYEGGKGERALEAALAAVEAMVVGCREDVEPRLLDGMQVLVGRTELRIALVGLSAKSGLEVSDGEIGTLDVVLHQSEAMVVCIAAIGL